MVDIGRWIDVRIDPVHAEWRGLVGLTECGVLVDRFHIGIACEFLGLLGSDLGSEPVENLGVDLVGNDPVDLLGLRKVAGRNVVLEHYDHIAGRWRSLVLRPCSRDRNSRTDNHQQRDCHHEHGKQALGSNQSG